MLWSIIIKNFFFLFFFLLCVGRTFVSEDEPTHLINFKSSPTRIRPRTGIRHFIQGIKSRIENQEVLKEFMVKCNSFLRFLAELRKWLLETFNILYGRFTDSTSSEDCSSWDRASALLFESCCSICISLFPHRPGLLTLFPVWRPHQVELKTNNTHMYNTNQFCVD